MSPNLSPEQLKIIDRIQKLLNLAAKNDNAEEAASAAAKAQQLLAQHNLDSATLEGADQGKREKSQIDGGTYAFQRELWRAVAELCFCVYWNQKYRTEEKVRQNIYEGGQYAGKKYVQVMRRRHAVIGRSVNARMTVAMAGYLQQAVERALTDRLAAGDEQRHSNWAWSFRKGCAGQIVSKLHERRWDNEAAEAERIRREIAAAKGASSGTALTISAYAEAEDDANYDFIHGEGASARKKARIAKERARMAGVQKAMEDAYTIWAAANPKKARSAFEYVDEEGRTWSYGQPRRGSGNRTTENIDYGAYRAGQEAGEKIGLDPQADGPRAPSGRISGPKAMHVGSR